MDDVPGRKRHPWTWIQWIVLAVFVALWIPALLDSSLAWMWIGFAGLLAIAFGVSELVAPTWVIETRRRFLSDAPRWQRRAAEAFDPPGAEPSTTMVRVIGAFLMLFGLGLVAGAMVILAQT